MKQIKAEVISNREIKPSYFKMAMNVAGLEEEVKAGQFINIRVTECSGVLLRKPLSVYSYCRKSGSLEVLYRTVGRGTEALSRKRGGEELDIIAPLGNGYELPAGPEPVVLVGGGTGAASLYFLAETLAGAGFSDARVLIGARDKENIICEKEFLKTGCKVMIATDDGSRGFGGVITELFKSIVPGMNPSTVVYACGPKPMLKIIAGITKKFKLSCQVSLEEYMACGVGACMSCAVKTKKQSGRGGERFIYKRACKDGPVFDGREIIWE